MSIDERLDRLAARHEALAESVELLVASQREHEKQWREWSREREQRAAQWQEQSRHYKGQQTLRDIHLDHLRQNTMLAVARLANAPHVHRKAGG